MSFYTLLSIGGVVYCRPDKGIAQNTIYLTNSRTLFGIVYYDRIMNDETLQLVVFEILKVLSTHYPNVYRQDGMNPNSNRIAGFIMAEIDRIANSTQLLVEGK